MKNEKLKRRYSLLFILHSYFASLCLRHNSGIL